MATTPSSIVIVGAGVFGLSTALALSHRDTFRNTKITVVEASATLPNPHGSSVDTSRIVRADYAQAPYADLAAKAQRYWREEEWGADGRYSECGLVLVADKNKEWYVRNSLDNVTKLAKEKGEEKKIEILENTEKIKKVMGEGTGAVGDWGYVNWGSGWADAGESVKWVLGLIEKEGRIEVRRGDVRNLVKEKEAGGLKVVGVEMADGEVLRADLVVLATGAWTGQLVDLRGRAEATGQCLAYLELTEEEQTLLEKKPIILNMSTGMFVIPPRNRLLKVARHAYGYRNLKLATSIGEDGEVVEVSTPMTGAPIPVEGERECRKVLRKIVPSLGDRPFVQTRICWYTDTPEGNFLVDYHPSYSGLFIATGGSGHGFKFFPVIGDKITDAIEGKLDSSLSELWAWPKNAVPNFEGTEDGSRSGLKGLLLEEELSKGMPGKL